MIKKWVVIMGLAYTILLAVVPVDSIDETKTASLGKILIVKGNSYLENAVTKILYDSCNSKGITVETEDIKKSDTRNPGKYTAIVVFSAIKASGRLDPVIRKYLKTKSNDPSTNVMVCTVYGEKWNNLPKTANAVSAATKTLNSAVVAAKIFSILVGSYLK